MAAAGPDLGAEQRAGPLGFDQNIGELFDVGRIADRFSRGAIGAGLGDARPLERHFGVEHVTRDFQIARPRRAVDRFAKSHRHHVGDAFGMRHGGGELRDRRHDIDVRQILQRAHLVLAERALPADHQKRTLGAKRIGDAGHRVGRARSRGRHDAADLAALARVAVGGVRRDLLMAHVDDLDAFVDAAVVDVDDMAAAKRPDHLDAFVLERLGDQMPAGDHWAGSFFFSFAGRCHDCLPSTGCLKKLSSTVASQSSVDWPTDRFSAIDRGKHIKHRFADPFVIQRSNSAREKSFCKAETNIARMNCQTWVWNAWSTCSFTRRCLQSLKLSSLGYRI